MKKIILATSILCSASSFAAGWLENASLYEFRGWACEPTTPSHQGWIHFWRDDDKFLGALHANGGRESAVGDLCGGNSYRGFNGTVSFPDSYLDNKQYKVHAFFIRENNTNFQLQGSPQTVFFASPNPVVIPDTAILSYAVPGGPPPTSKPSVGSWLCSVSCNLQSFMPETNNLQSKEYSEESLSFAYEDENGNISSMEMIDIK